MKAKSERRRPFVGDQLEDCRDASGLFYILPFQKVRYWCHGTDWEH
jgi:actin-related protein 6